MTRVGLTATAHYLPERVMSAAEVAAASGIPEHVVVEKFGLAGKHVAAADEHVSDLAVAAAERLLEEQAIDPAAIGALVYYGSTWKDYAVWQVAPWIAHRLGCVNAYAIEYDNVSMGTPVALRLAKAYLTAEPELEKVLLVAACRESYLLDYANERSRFMFNFGDGAVAGLLAGRRRPQSPPRLARDHRRVVLAPGEGAGRRERRTSVARDCRRAEALPGRRRPGADEGRARRGLPAELRRGG